jgi:hypothetical protein
VAIAIRPSGGMECADYDFDLGLSSSNFLQTRIFWLAEFSKQLNLRAKSPF